MHTTRVKKAQRPPKAQRLKESRGLRAKAPIAAEFEDCVQAFQQLSDSLQVDQSNSDLYHISKDSTVRLRLWGEDIGASSRTLDYVLRNNPVLNRQVLRLLVDLHRVLDEAIAGVLSQDAEAADGSAAADAAALMVVKEDAIPDDQEVESGPDMCLEEADDILSCLVQLLSALRDPLEEHFATVAAPDAESYSADIYEQLAVHLFPPAPKNLVHRFGESNWRRRQRLRHRPGGSLIVVGDQRPLVRPIKRSFIHWKRSPWRAEDHHDTPSAQRKSTFAESDADTSTARSHVETVMSRTVVPEQESMTSVTETPDPTILQHLVVPSAPVDLDKVRHFDCPLCHYELPLAFDSQSLGTQDWSAHFFQDLRPYSCTFDDCHRESRAFGDKEEWFQHELDCHRCQVVWFCGSCQTTFEEEKDLTEHFQSSHQGLSSSQETLLRQNCKRYSQLPLSDQPCVLCGQVCDSYEELKDHLADHLQAFALAALLDDELPGDDDSDSNEIVADYIEELSELREGGEWASSGAMFPPRTDAPPDQAALLDTDASDVARSTNPSNLDDGDNEIERPRARSQWTEKVEDYIGKPKERISPAIHSNHRDRYENFVGRDKDLQDIHDHLSIPGRICTVSGRGGIGKTALAIEYFYKYESDYSYIFWVEAENPGVCAEKYCLIGDAMHLEEKPDADADARVYTVRENLYLSDQRWLLIFDNVATWLEMARYVPRSLPRTLGSILITTRTGSLMSVPTNHPAYHHQYKVDLEPWPLEHGREFLLTSIQPTLDKASLRVHREYELAADVVRVVGLLPLAISMIVGYVKVSRCTLVDFMEMWEEKEHIMKNKRKKRNIDVDEGDIDSTIDSLWTIGIREVRVNSRRLLDVLSFLDPETIPKNLLVGDHKEDYLEFLNSSETLSYKRMISELLGRRLVTDKKTSKHETAYTIHRVLQQKVLLDMEDYGFADGFRKTFRLLRKRFPVANTQQVPVPGDWPACLEYMPHVFSFSKIYKKNAASASMGDPTPEEIAGLFYDAGFYVWGSQNTAYDGLWFLDLAEDIIRDIELGQNDRIRADIQCIKGLLLLNQGCVERAGGLKRLEHAYEIRRRIHKQNPVHDNDVLLQNAANDYSLCLLNEHQFIEAGRMFSSCREQYKRWGPESENPFENSKYYGNYSLVYMWMGEMAKAIEYQERAIRLTEKFFGRKAMYYRRVFMQACLYLQAGDLQGALDRHLEALTARMELHGKHNEYTIGSMYAVGAMYAHLGDTDTATKYMQQCIAQERNSKWDRAALARAQYLLALLYREQGIQEDSVESLEAEAQSLLDEFSGHAAACVVKTGDKMMILDDLQPTFLGRYTGRKLLKHLQECDRRGEL